MPGENLPTRPLPLSPSGRRALASTMLATSGQLPPYSASLLIEALDAMSWVVLAVGGATPLEAQQILSALWVTDGEGDGG